MTKTRIENNNNGRIFTNIPDVWIIPIKKSYLKYCENFIEKNITMNIYLKNHVYNMAIAEVDISDFIYEQEKKPFLKDSKKYRGLNFNKEEIKDIYKHIKKMEHKIGHTIKNDHYVIACLWESMPFLRKISDQN